MSTEKEPDFELLAKNAAEERFLQPDIVPPGGRIESFGWLDGYASCMEARLRSDWETIRLLRNEQRLLEAQELTLTDALKSHLSKLLEPFTS